MTCEKCMHWNFDRKEEKSNNTEAVVGECRIRSVAQNYFPERFNYESCGEFASELSPFVKSDAPTSYQSKCEGALKFLEENSRPTVKATSVVWDGYINRIKAILKGEE